MSALMVSSHVADYMQDVLHWRLFSQMINYWISLPRFDAVSEVQFMYIYSTVVLSTLLGNLSSFHYTAPYTFYVAGLERYHVEQRLVPIVIEAVFYSNLKTALFCRVGSGALLSRKSFRSGKSFGSRTLTHRTIAHRTVSIGQSHTRRSVIGR